MFFINYMSQIHICKNNLAVWKILRMKGKQKSYISLLFHTVIHAFDIPCQAV